MPRCQAPRLHNLNSRRQNVQYHSSASERLLKRYWRPSNQRIMTDISSQRGGQGCRFWLDKVAALMQENRITDSESETQAARSALQQVCYSESQLFPAAQITGMTPGASH
ncbi:uncharacterized protein PADG_11141 [Paracoccidioides brasiliensis Pb18]|uniref:DUF7770 domain-containing protein n=1 Tax=Paracoccidioides brasiliensis (strain Pb18) TaxID=502780 RepID=A0A0A0HU38_PARBD|nr:uncharacterized protein PADG_11141 [Paracoccidioides brasiliensis Pb18]KGM92684.1 hypothetical protein PADG_11141 [Paracoccidioides brasiliensis Pb18]